MRKKRERKKVPNELFIFLIIKKHRINNLCMPLLCFGNECGVWHQYKYFHIYIYIILFVVVVVVGREEILNKIYCFKIKKKIYHTEMMNYRKEEITSTTSSQ